MTTVSTSNNLTGVTQTATVISTPPTPTATKDGYNIIQGKDDAKIEILKGTAGADIFVQSTGGDIIVNFDPAKDYIRFKDKAVTKYVYSETSQPSAGRYMTAITGIGSDNTILAGITIMAPLSDVKNRLQKSDGTPLVTLAWPSDNVREVDGDITIIYGGEPASGLGTSGNDTLEGGSSWDALRGKEGDDILFGGGSPDGLMGGAGNDTLDGGSGNDSYGGGAGKDTFIIGPNPGEDFILDFNKSDGDTIKITDTGVKKVTVDEFKTNSGQYVTVVSGLDDKGTVRTKTFVNASKDSLANGIVDSDGEALFTGGSKISDKEYNIIQGKDDAKIEILKGTAGADIFLKNSFNQRPTESGPAADIVVDFDPNKDYLRFTDPTIVKIGFSEIYQPSAGRYVTNVWGFSADDKALAAFTVLAPRNEIENRIQNNKGILIKDVYTGGTTITDTSGGTTTIYGGDPAIGGTSGNDNWMGRPIWDSYRGKEGNDTLFGGAGTDGLLGGDGDDILDGGSDNDALVGGAGKDTFVIGANAGEDFIYDFNKSEGDTIKIADTRVTKVTVDETKTASGQYVTVVSGLDDKGTVLTKTFVNASKDSLANGIVDIEGKALFTGGGTTPTAATTSGTDLAETVDGTDQNDTIDGKGGNDLLYGEAGADTFLEGKTSDVDTIVDF
ncbi:MAG: calcium-binding protein, partial [Holosporales bacterium]